MKSLDMKETYICAVYDKLCLPSDDHGRLVYTARRGCAPQDVFNF